jgi:hypothetical protein
MSEPNSPEKQSIIIPPADKNSYLVIAAHRKDMHVNVTQRFGDSRLLTGEISANFRNSADSDWLKMERGLI